MIAILLIITLVMIVGALGLIAIVKASEFHRKIDEKDE